MKNLKDIYVVELFVPEEFSLTNEFGWVDLKLCKKEEEKYIELKSGNSYIMHNQIGYTKVVAAVPLNEYYFNSGIKKINNHSDKKSVHRLVKQFKRDGII